MRFEAYVIQGLQSAQGYIAGPPEAACRGWGQGFQVFPHRKWRRGKSVPERLTRTDTECNPSGISMRFRSRPQIIDESPPGQPVPVHPEVDVMKSTTKGHTDRLAFPCRTR